MSPPQCFWQQSGPVFWTILTLNCKDSTSIFTQQKVVFM
jgi:hypothetical protein